jgi:hypothetical protein
MAKIEFPSQLKALLEDSDLQAPVRDLANRVGELLDRSTLPFFPDYTDHGVEHVNRVLKSEVELVPKEVWERSKRDSDPRLLCDADAVVIIGATLLHDIAMHLHPEGFLELVGKDSRFQPLPWFCESHEGQAADVAWHELWEEYLREARRFSDRDLTNIIGEESARLWKFDALPADSGQWELNHRLIVGEFIRRHHARLAHEIAIYGFPGSEVGSGAEQFPAMGAKGHPLNLLADLIGLTARSHGLNLRVCKAYLDATPRYSGTPRPMGTAALYPMALLRVADYLQIDRQRAPAVLLQLRNPQSPISVQEWKTHLAVQHIGPTNDPRGKMVTVSSDLSLPLYLHLRELLSGLQAEMDHSTAVLDEAYGAQSALGLDRLNLAIRRVDSNLQSPAFRDALPYVPNKTGFAADPNLLTLLVEPLYGKEPGVGVRELMQNAVDAVCELDAWCKVHDVPIDSLDLPEQEGDVMIDFIKRDDGSWFLRVQDRGIGMTSDNIQNYFLRAGASFRRSSEWSKEFVDEKGKPRVARAGRFGIGVFAVFLLGPSFKMWTRHVGTDKSMGYMVEATANSQLIEIQRDKNCFVGTKIEVKLSQESVEILGLDEESKYLVLKSKIDWFCWDWPQVVKRVIADSKSKNLKQRYEFPIRRTSASPEWSVIYPEGYDAVFWTFTGKEHISCNGIAIEPPNYNPLLDGSFLTKEIEFKSPIVAVIDSAASLPVTTQRYSLIDSKIPFIAELGRDVTLSFIAYSLVCGPASWDSVLSGQHRYPLQMDGIFFPSVVQDIFSRGRLTWCATSKGIVPADPWLYKLLNAESCLMYGLLGSHAPYFKGNCPDVKKILQQVIDDGHAIVPLRTVMDYYESDDISEEIWQVFSNIVREGLNFIGLNDATHMFVSSMPDLDYDIDDPELEADIEIWEKVQRNSYEAQSGTFKTALNLQPFFEIMKTKWAGKGIVYIGEFKAMGVDTPESMIAKIWNECLGPRAIPFDPVAREALIAEGCKHPELKRHIEAWQEMKRTGSKWATGEWMNKK